MSPVLGRADGTGAGGGTLARHLAPETPKLASVLRYGASYAGAYALRRAVYLPHEVDAIRNPGFCVGCADRSPSFQRDRHGWRKY